MRRYARRTPSGSSRVRHAAGWLRVNMLGWQAVARAIAVIGETDSPRARIRAGTRMRIVERHRPLGDSLASLPDFTRRRRAGRDRRQDPTLVAGVRGQVPQTVADLRGHPG